MTDPQLEALGRLKDLPTACSVNSRGGIDRRVAYSLIAFGYARWSDVSTHTDASPPSHIEITEAGRKAYDAAVRKFDLSDT